MKPKSFLYTMSDIRIPSWRLILFWTVLIALIVFTIEAGAAAATWALLKSPMYDLFWNPDADMVRTSWLANATQWDEELSWSPPDTITSDTRRDVSGAKYNADFPDPRGACASAYGDSFIWGADVALTDGWVEALSRRLGCRVSNYGVSGYGVDQAFIRFRRLSDDKAPTVLLGIFPDDIVRDVNQYRSFMGFEPNPVWLKGRFILDDAGALQWIARPRLDADSFLDMHREPGVYLPYEYLLPDTHDGPVTVRFPFILTLARLAMMPRFWNRLRGQTPWADFYTFGHSSGAVPLTVAIVAAFVHAAEQRGKQVFVVMLPSPASFLARERFGAPDYAAFTKAMAGKGIDVFDPAPALLAVLKERSYCELYLQRSRCRGHFGVAGGTKLAEVVADELERRNLVKKMK